MCEKVLGKTKREIEAQVNSFVDSYKRRLGYPERTVIAFNESRHDF